MREFGGIERTVAQRGNADAVHPGSRAQCSFDARSGSSSATGIESDRIGSAGSQALGRPRRRRGPRQRLSSGLDDGDVLLVQLLRHVLVDGLFHVIEADPVAQNRQRAQKRRVRNRPSQDGRRDAVGIQRDDAVVGERARAVHQNHPVRLELAIPSLAQQRIVQIHDVIRADDGAAIADGPIRQLRERAHRRAASLGAERGERQRMRALGKRCRRSQQARGRERALPAASMPQNFDHGPSPFASACRSCQYSAHALDLGAKGELRQP